MKGFTEKQFKILKAIVENGGSAIFSEIHRECDIHVWTIAVNLNRMCESGIIIKGKRPYAYAQKSVYLMTKDGIELYKKLEELFN